jgi:hypothetical protein
MCVMASDHPTRVIMHTPSLVPLLSGLSFQCVSSLLALRPPAMPPALTRLTKLLDSPRMRFAVLPKGGAALTHGPCIGASAPRRVSTGIPSRQDPKVRAPKVAIHPAAH